MVDKERLYTIPLRKSFLKAVRYKRTAKAVKTVREFLVRHLKSDKIKLGKYLNQKLWEKGMKNPPSKVQVKVIQKGEVYTAELVNAPVEETKVQVKKPSLKERLGAKKPTEEKSQVELKKEEVTEEKLLVKEEKPTEAKKIIKKKAKKEE